MSRVVVLAIACIVVVAGSASANLLQDPGFEAYGAGWFWTAQDCAVEGWAAHTGDRGMAFYTWNSYGDAYVGQRVTGIVPGLQYEFGGYLLEEAGHIGSISLRIEWYDSSDNRLWASEVSKPVDPATEWGWFEVTAAAPATAAAANFLVFDAAHSPGSGSQAIKFDDASVTAVPEPATVLALGAGLVGLLPLRKRAD